MQRLFWGQSWRRSRNEVLSGSPPRSFMAKVTSFNWEWFFENCILHNPPHLKCLHWVHFKHEATVSFLTEDRMYDRILEALSSAQLLANKWHLHQARLSREPYKNHTYKNFQHLTKFACQCCKQWLQRKQFTRHSFLLPSTCFDVMHYILDVFMTRDVGSSKTF